MRTKKAANNVLGSLAYQLVTNIIGLILPRLLITTYGSMINGLISSIRQMLNYLKQMEMGLAGAVIIELYKPLAQKNDAEVSRVLSASRHFYNWTGVLFSIGVVILALAYPLLVDCKGLPWYYVTTLVLLLGLSGAISFFFVSSYLVLLTADQRSYIVSLTGAGIGVLSSGLMVVAILCGFDILIIPLISVAGALITAYLLNLYTRHIYGSRFRFNLPAKKTAIPQRSAVFLNEFSFIVELNAPVIIATLVLGLTAVSVLSVYNMVFRSLRSMSKTLPRSLRASFGEVSALGTGHHDTLLRAYNEYEFVYFLIVAWVYTTAGILLLPFMRVYTQGITDANYERPLLGGLLLAIGVLRQLKVPSNTLVGAAGKFREIRGNAIQTAILGVFVGFVGAYLAGLPGLLVGFVVSATYRSVFIIHFCHRHLLKTSFRRIGKRILLNSLLFISAWLPFIFWIQIETLSIWLWFLWAAGVFTWTGLVFLLGNFAFDRITFQFVFVRLKTEIQKRFSKQPES